jgi:hypothetical protein
VLPPALKHFETNNCRIVTFRQELSRNSVKIG